MTPTRAELDALRALLEKATPGEWRDVAGTGQYANEVHATTKRGKDLAVARVAGGRDARAANAALIASLRNVAEYLLACHDALRELLPVAQETCKRWPNDDCYLVPTAKARDLIGGE